VAVQENIQKLADIVGRRPAQVIEDLKIVKKMKQDPIWAINHFFVQGKGWMYEPLTDYQEEGARVFFSDKKMTCHVWPRAHLKTTLFTKICCALEVILGLSPYTVIFSSTEDNVKGNKQAFETIFTRPLFRELQWYLPYFFGSNIVDIRSDEFVFGANQAIIELRSFSGESRGLNREGRPTRLHLDDILRTEAATSFAIREDATDRYFSMIRPMGESGSKISVVGTVLHRDDIIWKIATGKVEGFETSVKPAYDEKTKKVLWPSLWTYERLIRIRDEEYAKAGRIHLFKREYLCDPAESDTHPLQGYSIKRVEKLERNNCFRVVAIDNAQGTGQDNFVVMETGEYEDGKIGILSVRFSNQWNIDRRVEEAMMVLRRRMPDVIVIQRTSESIALIELLTKAMKAENMRKSITQPTWTKAGTNKEIYINSWLQPTLAEGGFIAEYNQSGIDEIDEELHSFDAFAAKNKDDLIECLAHCKKYSKSPKIVQTVKPTGNPLRDKVLRDMMRKERTRFGKIPWV